MDPSDVTNRIFCPMESGRADIVPSEFRTRIIWFCIDGSSDKVPSEFKIRSMPAPPGKKFQEMEIVLIFLVEKITMLNNYQLNIGITAFITI